MINLFPFLSESKSVKPLSANSSLLFVWVYYSSVPLGVYARPVQIQLFPLLPHFIGLAAASRLMLRNERGENVSSGTPRLKGKEEEEEEEGERRRQGRLSIPRLG